MKYLSGRRICRVKLDGKDVICSNVTFSYLPGIGMDIRIVLDSGAVIWDDGSRVDITWCEKKQENER